MGRVAAIGLDAMEWRVAEQLAAAGRMPALSSLLARGSRCVLENVIPYRSELPWTQFLTGRTATSNGYWSTVEFDPESYDAYTIGAHPVAPFYALGEDTKVIAFDVPHSVPDSRVNGVQVTAWGAHSPQFARASEPRGVLAEVDARFGTHPGFENDYDGAWYVPQFIDTLAEVNIEGARRRVDAVQWLMEREPDWDFLFTVMSEPHSAGHHMWHGIDERHPLHRSKTGGQARRRLIEVYSAVDAEVGRLIEALPSDTTVVVFAVHGMQPNANDVPSMVLLPELLHRLEFNRSLLGIRGESKSLADSSGFVVPSERQHWLTTVRRRFGEGLTGRTRRLATAVAPDDALERVLKLRRRLKGLPEPRMPWELRDPPEPETSFTVEEVIAQRGDVTWQPPMWYRAYWPRMRWFTLPTFSDAHVRINLQGRERDGIVAPGDYHRACDEFEEIIRQSRNPRTGREVVDEVIRVRADDPLAPGGADGDLVVLWKEPFDALEHPQAGVIGPVAFNRTGEHSSNGFAVIAGPGIGHDDLGTRSAFDLTPTVLALLGKEPDADLAGRAMMTRPVAAG
ncbi:alkaline phosphatase family protein [Desertimonas flava]|uniref:alkaline phosphatase family protein n=1 Tax=Desertimonas flava TaxID=2064846 RepID=UPI000E34B581|nr:alkaline phosphatase family protein [Desertimonas flava]